MADTLGPMTSLREWSRLPRVATAMVVVLLVTAACGQSPAGAVDGIEAVFPTLAEYHVTNLYRTDECEYIAYARGAFVTDPDAFECEIDVEGPYPRRAIDYQARADLDAIYRESERHGPRLQAAFPEFADDHIVKGGSFGFHWCTSYIYEPGWKALPPDDSETVTAVNSDWYEVKCLSATLGSQKMG